LSEPRCRGEEANRKSNDNQDRSFVSHSRGAFRGNTNL
jgi:hypothetical protein